MKSCTAGSAASQLIRSTRFKRHAQRAAVDGQVVQAGADEDVQLVALRLGVVELAAHDVRVAPPASARSTRRRLQQVMAARRRLLRERARALQPLDAQLAQQLVLVQVRGVVEAVGLVRHQRHPVDARRR